MLFKLIFTNFNSHHCRIIYIINIHLHPIYSAQHNNTPKRYIMYICMYIQHLGMCTMKLYYHFSVQMLLYWFAFFILYIFLSNVASRRIELTRIRARTRKTARGFGQIAVICHIKIYT